LKDIDEEPTHDEMLVVADGLRMMNLLLIRSWSCKQGTVAIHKLSGAGVRNNRRD